MLPAQLGRGFANAGPEFHDSMILERRVMKKQAEGLARGVYIAPWRDPATHRPAIVVIDRGGCCIHLMIHEAGETEDEALSRAQALLDLIDTEPS